MYKYSEARPTCRHQAHQVPSRFQTSRATSQKCQRNNCHPQTPDGVYMDHRRYFLSNDEIYDPAKNMHMFASHAFELSEDILNLNNDFAGSHRKLDFVATCQRDVKASVGAVGTDLGGLREGINVLRTEVHSVRTGVRSREHSRAFRN